MAWIERTIGWAPDGGSGSLETLLVLGPLLLIAALWTGILRRRRTG